MVSHVTGCDPLPVWCCDTAPIRPQFSQSIAHFPAHRLSFFNPATHSKNFGQFLLTINASPPPTPPARSPNDDEFRFKTITSPCEWIESYHPGGYHPVHLGDLFHHDQYKATRKLGEGSYSTVWLARDLKSVPQPLTISRRRR